MLRVLKAVALAAVILVGALSALLAYSCFFGGPRLEVSRSSNGLHVQGRFLGEYALGFDRVRIVDAATGAIVCDLLGSADSDMDLRPGTNDPSTMFGAGTSLSPQPGTASRFQLQPGRVYRITVWGNNGSGYVRSSRISIRL
jgi:type II secretory pathway pseudopilin PulG